MIEKIENVLMSLLNEQIETKSLAQRSIAEKI